MNTRHFLGTAATALIVLTAAAAWPAGAARAADCAHPAADAAKDVDAAAVIFTGGVSGVQELPVEKGKKTPERKTMFTADKFYKGASGSAVSVYQMHDPNGDLRTFKVGTEYLVLADKGDYGPQIDGCSPVMALDPAAARSDEPGAEYRAAVAKVLGDGKLFPAAGAAK